MDIKRCPHCDSYFYPPEIWKSVTRSWWEPRFNLYCPSCHWCGERAFTRRGAIRKWNNDVERYNKWRNCKWWR